jgi:alpha-beta hydrolase superfamily lysophospholipase
MLSFGKWAGRVLALLVVTVAVLWLLVPRDGLDPRVTFDAAALPEDLDGWLATREAVFTDITPGAQKQIVWAGAMGAKTPLAVVYLHGFSATLEEVRPLPDDVAKGLGANLYYTRLAGHGRPGAALGDVVPEDWITDLDEALAIGHRLGDRVLLISTSTGGTLATLAAVDPARAQGLAGVVMISPNYRLRDTLAQTLLDAPLIRYWGGLVAGEERSFEPSGPEHAKWWTTRYPTAALYPMAALMRGVRAMDPSKATVPALFIASPEDRVVDPATTADIAARWGAAAQVEHPVLTAADDPWHHVLAGRVLSPTQTGPMVAMILDWARGL